MTWCLLDTHSFLWAINAPAHLSDSARTVVAAQENVIFVSYVSLWEIAIKVSIGKMHLPQPFERFVYDQIVQNNFRTLSIEPRHINAVVHLPLHHRDPFDRLLVAQASTENMLFISRDPIFDDYSVQRLW
jgi:PIN domain nuclease of toxin-antitoxin system